MQTGKEQDFLERTRRLFTGLYGHDIGLEGSKRMTERLFNLIRLLIEIRPDEGGGIE